MPSPTDLTELAAAKINLFLHVAGKRADGYHELVSLVVFADMGDRLGFVKADSTSCLVNGPFRSGLAGERNNLVLRAVKSFAKRNGSVSVCVSLEKNLPVASGIGGGSADAAATLRGLARLNPVGIENLLDIAAELGSDVPACVLSRALMMRGRGEALAPVDTFPKLHAVLVNPGIEVTTANVFAGLAAQSGEVTSPDLTQLQTLEALIAYLATTRNDLQEPAIALAPIIGDVLDEIGRTDGVRLARMSGSGATCFGLYASKAAAAQSARHLLQAHPQWWVKAATLS